MRESIAPVYYRDFSTKEKSFPLSVGLVGW